MNALWMAIYFFMSHSFLLYYTVDISNSFANIEDMNNIQYALY